MPDLVNSIVLECCVETLEHALRSDTQGVHQIEICSRLDLDGLSPSIELVTAVQQHCKAIPKVMIRPRGGDFVYDSLEIRHMIEEIKRWKSNGISQIVLGVLTDDNDINLTQLEKLCAAADGMQITFHKAIDLVNDPLRSIEQLKLFDNIKYILSSGQAPIAWDGRDTLKKMVQIAADQLEIIVAGKVRHHNLVILQEATGARFFHGRGF